MIGISASRSRIGKKWPIFETRIKNKMKRESYKKCESNIRKVKKKHIYTHTQVYVTEAGFARGSVYFVESAFPEALRILHLSLPMHNRFVRKRFFPLILFPTHTHTLAYLHIRLSSLRFLTKSRDNIS